MFSKNDLPNLMKYFGSAGITRVANITGLDTLGIPVTLVTRPNSRSLSVTQGKGDTLDQARLSGIMEAFEHFHAEQTRLPLTLASWTELRAYQRVVSVERLPRTPRKFEKNTRILWAKGQNLVDQAPVAVPYEMVHLDFSTPLPEGSGYFALSSNGLASGSTLEQATAHGLWEVVERDALALFYERGPEQQAQRRVALKSIDDPRCRALIVAFESAEVGVAVWDMTTDIGIPTFMCSAGETQLSLRQVGTARGYGCHPERGVALRRALTEAAQSRLTRIAGSRDDIQSNDFDAIRSEAAFRRQQDHLLQEPFAARSFIETPNLHFDDESDALAWTVEQLRTSGMPEVVRVDLSREDWPVKVARCIVPGLEGLPDAPWYIPGERAQCIKRLAERS